MGRRFTHTMRVVRSEEGQTMAEYAVVLTFIAAACAYLFPQLSGQVQAALSVVTSHLP